MTSLAAACGGHHKHDDRVWTAEEIAELEYKWGMEVGAEAFLLSPLSTYQHGRAKHARTTWQAMPRVSPAAARKISSPVNPGRSIFALTADVMAVGCRRACR